MPQSQHVSSVSCLKTGKMSKAELAKLQTVQQQNRSYFGALNANLPVKHKVVHRTITKGAPGYCRPRPLLGDKLKTAKQYFMDFQEKGVV